MNCHRLSGKNPASLSDELQAFPVGNGQLHWPFLIRICHFSRPVFLGYERTICQGLYCLSYILISSIIYERHPCLISNTFLDLIAAADGNLICFTWLLLESAVSLKKKISLLIFCVPDTVLDVGYRMVKKNRHILLYWILPFVAERSLKKKKRSYN